MNFTLSHGITDTDTSLSVTGMLSDVPATGVITIESEQILYERVSDSQFLLLTRAHNSTTAAAHAAKTALTVAPVPGATKSFVNVGADISLTPIFVAPVSGMYMLSFYGLATVAPTGTDTAPNLYTGWTDEYGAQRCFDFAGNLDATFTDGPNSSTRPIYCMAGTPVTFSTSAGDYTGTVKWSFHFSVTPL